MTCIDAFKNLSIAMRSNSLQIAPCCISTHLPYATVDFFDNRYLKEVRKDWNNNTFPLVCSSCKRAEDSNISSRRIGSNQWYHEHNITNTDVELIRIDYWVGDLCNLKCIICGPENSSSWKQELNLPNDIKKTVNNQIWKTLDLSKIKFVHFTGGEPLLSKEHIILLQSIENKKKVHLNYNTNGTILPSPELLDLWKEFELVHLDFSIDDIGERFEYQRFPAKWDNVTNNLTWYINNAPTNCMFSINTTVSVLNYYTLDNLKSWARNNFFANRLADPVNHRQQLAEGLFALSKAKENRVKILKFLDDCDKRRGTDWRKVMPELDKNI